MNAKISVLVSCNEAMIYLLLYDLRDSTFKDIRSEKISQVSFVSIINFEQVIASRVLLSKRVQI